MNKLMVHRKNGGIIRNTDLEHIWGFDRKVNRPREEQTQAYLDHFINLLQSSPPTAPFLDVFTNLTHLSELVDIVKTNRSLSVDEVCTAISTASTGWTKLPFDDCSARHALQFVLKLWLFSEPCLGNGQVLAANTQALYEPLVHNAQAPAAHIRWLSSDFSARSLTRKGGFYIVWTSTLSEHLTFVSKTQLRVFRHAHVLRHYQCSIESEMYPVGFLEETYRTIDLLFPCGDIRAWKRARRLVRKRHVDIETTVDVEKMMEEHTKLQISEYTFYGPRLAEIQRRYDLAKPRRLKQWWYDRRQKQDWGALMVAIVVFALTVVFGVISSVTGIMQVWASFEALKR